MNSVMRPRVDCGGQLSGLSKAEGVTSSLVVVRLEEAGRTLLSLPASGYSTKMRVSRLDIGAREEEAFGHRSPVVRAPMPSAAQITRMDEALGWLSLIPADRHVLRRIVGARSLVSPINERHLFSWRRLAGVLGADHKAVQRWHAQGITMLVEALRLRIYAVPG